MSIRDYTRRKRTYSNKNIKISRSISGTLETNAHKKIYSIEPQQSTGIYESEPGPPVWTTPNDFGDDLFFLYDVATASTSGGLVTSIPDQGPLGVTATCPVGDEFPYVAANAGFNGNPTLSMDRFKKANIKGIHSGGSASWFIFAVLVCFNSALKPQNLIGFSGTTGLTGVQTVNGYGANQIMILRGDYSTRMYPTPVTIDLYIFSEDAVAGQNQYLRSTGAISTKAFSGQVAVTSTTNAYLCADSNGNGTEAGGDLAYIGGVKRPFTATDLTNLRSWSTARFGTP